VTSQRRRADSSRAPLRNLTNHGQLLFLSLADTFSDDPDVTHSTMMGYPCLRSKGSFFACVERTTGHLVVKLPAPRVRELIALGRAISFAPNGRVFKEWAAFPGPDRKEWRGLLQEARAFVNA